MFPIAGAEGVGVTVTASADEVAPVPHELVANTLKFPEEAFALKLTVMVLVLAPEVMVAPTGSDQV